MACIEDKIMSLAFSWTEFLYFDKILLNMIKRSFMSLNIDLDIALEQQIWQSTNLLIYHTRVTTNLH